MRRCIQVVGLVGALGLALSVLALDGLDDTTVTALFDEGTVQTAIGWSGKTEFGLGAPWRNGGEAADDGAGTTYLLVHGWTPSSDPDDPQPMSTGLVAYDGSSFDLLAECAQDQGSGPHTGTLMRVVRTAPCAVGTLSAGQPVVLRWNVTEAGGELVYAVELVGVDPNGTQSVLATFGPEAADATVVFDADGTLYVGPMSDGSIVEVAYVGGAYTPSSVPTSHEAGVTLAVDSAGYLYTFDKGATGSSVTGTDAPVYRIDPDTGSVSIYAAIDGWTFFHDLTWSGGKLWAGCREGRVKGNKVPRRFVAEVGAGQVASVEDAITNSSNDPNTVAPGGDGTLLVLETVVGGPDGLYRVSPGAGGGGKPPKRSK